MRLTWYPSTELYHFDVRGVHLLKPGMGGGAAEQQEAHPQQLERKGRNLQTAESVSDSVGGRTREICFVTVIEVIFSPGSVAWETWKTEAAVAPQILDI